MISQDALALVSSFGSMLGGVLVTVLVVMLLGIMRR